jgi:subtilisin-like proprotein convertase family protein
MKKIYPKKQLLLLLMTFCTMFLFSQNRNSYWKKNSKEKLETEQKVRRASHPGHFEVFDLDLEKFQLAIEGAPLRGEFTGKSSVIAQFPTPEGIFERFRISESPIMEPGLAEKFPMIKTYKAVGVDDPTATMRFSITQFGLHTMTLSGKRNSMYVDPYTEDRKTYMVYDRNSLGADNQDFECLTDQGVKLKSLENDVSVSRVDSDDQKLRTYRLAQTCSGEYGAIFDGAGTDAQKKANIQAQMAITVNRVNEIYERDLAITLVFIARNDELIYYDGGTDPWSGEYNTKTQEVITTTLNDESLYDIGHNFNTSGGGNAGCLGCVCVDGIASGLGDTKGRGHTGRANPTGDPFDIDYVAHEMGHQFDGYHTQASSGCASGNGFTEVEPGSGSSIMGYAGICAANVQGNSDAHFNYVNIRDITTNIQTGTSSSCAAELALTNQPPIAITEGLKFYIPKSTPFVLRGNSTDPDGTTEHTFGWSQNDPEPGGMGTSAPSATATSGPVYRSILPTASPDRYMPNISDVVANDLTPTWEVTPSVARTLNFALVVRDNASGFANGIGQTDSELMVVDVENVTPFTVATPNTAVSWEVGSAQTVTWNVGATTNATINCQNVNIKLSTDGGYTYPYVILSNTPNDGSESITIPNNITSTARIMVEAADNIFYDISNTNFSIVAPTNPTFILTVPVAEKDQVICTGTSPVVNISYDVFSGFAENTVFSATGNPAGSTTNFSVNNINTTQAVVMSLGNTASVTPGVYPVSITATSASVVRTEVINFTVFDSTFTTPSLAFPSNGVTGVGTSVSLAWGPADVNVENYEVQVATNPAFTANLSTYNSTVNSYDLSGLAVTTVYYWRVAPKNRCGTGVYSGTYSFTTVTPTCLTYNSTQNNITIPSGGNPNQYPFTATSTKTISGVSATAIITDINVTINIDHIWAGDMDIKLTSPAGTQVVLLANSKCDDGTDDINVIYDDEGSVLVCSTSVPAVGGITIPESALSAFDGEGLNGDWVLEATDAHKDDGGEFLNFSMEICSGEALNISENNPISFDMYPNPSNGIVTVSFKTNEAVQVSLLDVRGRKVYTNLYSNNSEIFTKKIDFSTIASGVYLINLSSGNKSVTKKIVIQ